jgi:hypothetical protein
MIYPGPSTGLAAWGKSQRLARSATWNGKKNGSRGDEYGPLKTMGKGRA